MGKTKDNQLSTTPTLISKGCVVQGIIESNVFMRVDGNIKGDLFIDEKLIVGEEGLIEGNIETHEIVVYGTINGSVKAEYVNIKSTGKIIGELNTSTLHVEKGAIYLGSVAMKKNKIDTR